MCDRTITKYNTDNPEVNSVNQIECLDKLRYINARECKSKCMSSFLGRPEVTGGKIQSARIGTRVIAWSIVITPGYQPLVRDQYAFCAFEALTPHYTRVQGEGQKCELAKEHHIL